MHIFHRLKGLLRGLSVLGLVMLCACSSEIDLPDDELEELLVGKSSQEKGQLLNRWAKDSLATAPEKSMMFAEYALDIGERLDDEKMQFHAYINLGNYHQAQAQHSHAYDDFIAALTLANRMDDKKLMGEATLAKANVAAITGDAEKAISYYQNSNDLYAAVNDTVGIADCMRGMADEYQALGDSEKARKLYREAIEMSKRAGDPKGYATAMANLASSLIGQSQTHPELLKPALEYMLEVEQVYIQENLRQLLPTTYYLIAAAYIRDDNLPKGYVFTQKMLAEAISQKSRSAERDAYFLLRYYFEANDQLDSALVYFDKYVALNETISEEVTRKLISEREAEYQREKEAIEEERMYNLQMSGIFGGVAIILLGVLLLGSVHLPFKIYSILVFFSFILLFEFILLFTEPWVDDYAEGAPIIKLGINLSLALMFTPLHYAMERRVKARKLRAAGIDPSTVDLGH